MIKLKTNKYNHKTKAFNNSQQEWIR